MTRSVRIWIVSRVVCALIVPGANWIVNVTVPLVTSTAPCTKSGAEGTPVPGTTSPSGSVTSACKISDAAGDELVVGEPPQLATTMASTHGAARGPIVIARRPSLITISRFGAGCSVMAA